MPDTTLSPRLRHLLIQEQRHAGDLSLPLPALIRTSRDDSPPYSPEIDYEPLAEKLPPSTVATPLLPIETVMGQRPSHSILNLLNSLIVESPPSSSGSISPRSTPEPQSTAPVHRIPPPPMSAPLPTSHPPWFTREHRPSVDVPSTTVHRPDLYRRHSAHPYEVNPITNRIIYREFDFSPVGSRAPISRTTKACNACRSRKVRCDAGGDTGEPTTCSRCREAGVECVYSGVQKRRGPCPGAARPGTASRQPSQRITLTPPPELSPTFTSRSSYGYFPPETDPHYLPPVTPNEPYHPPQSQNQPPGHPGHPGLGWTSSQPRPLNPSVPFRRPTTQHNRKPSVVSWHPSDIPEERVRMFEKGYSMQALADENEMRASAEDERWRSEPLIPNQRQSSEVFSINPPGMGSAFGGDGRRLPPLRIALGGGSSYYEPRGN